MKIAIIVSSIKQLGPIKVVQALVNSLIEFKELEIKVFYLDKTTDPEVKILVPMERFRSHSFNFDDYDIIHTTGIRPDLIAFINRKKIRYHISTIHNLVFEDLSYTYNRFISLIFGNIWMMIWRRADILVCVSETMKNYYSKWFFPVKLEVIYNGIANPEKSFLPDSDLIRDIDLLRSEGLKILGFAGILTKRKGLDQLISLLAKETGLALIILGDGKGLPALMQLVKRNGLTGRCLFFGFRSNAINYFRLFDFIIIPSRSEGFGLVLIEAAQQKVPIICSDIEVFRELMNADEVTFFKLEDITSLTNALKVATETRYKKPDLAYIRYSDNYTDKLMAKRYYDLYKSA
jgi:glycosyltransferase involved in cell wall biosynthesis